MLKSYHLVTPGDDVSGVREEKGRGVRRRRDRIRERSIVANGWKKGT